MAHHMSISPAPVPEPTPPRHALLVDYQDGDLLWTTQNDDNHNTSNLNRINRSQIIFILHHRKSSGYVIYTLHEHESAKEDESENGNAKPPFELCTLYAAQLPEDPRLAEFILDEIPAHLRSDGIRLRLDVVVSTRSGIGQAGGFYEGVLHPLLEGIGLRGRRLGLSAGAGEEGDGLQIGGSEGSNGGGKSGYGFRYRVVVTESARTVRDYARGLGSEGDREGREGLEKTIVLLSGDGGVVDLLNGIDRSESAGRVPAPTIAVLPLGTGNALFHSLHKPLYAGSNGAEPKSPGTSSLVLGLRTLFRGVTAPLPTFRAEFSPGARLVSSPEHIIDDDTLSTISSGSNDHPSSNSPSDGSNDDPESPTDSGSISPITNDNGTNSTTSPSASTLPSTPPSPAHPPITHLLGTICASLAFHASLVHESDTHAYRRHGSARFGMAASELLKISHAYDATVEVIPSSSSSCPPSTAPSKYTQLHPGKLSEGKFNYILLSMVSNLEKGFTISPESKPLDGKMRLIWFGDLGGERTMDVMRGGYEGGRHVGMVFGEGEEGEEERVGYEEVEAVKVTVWEEEDRWRKVCIDGTIVEVEKGGWVRVRREEVQGGRVKVLVDGGVL